ETINRILKIIFITSCWIQDILFYESRIDDESINTFQKNLIDLEQKLHGMMRTLFHTLKNNLTNFSNVNTKDYVKIKRALKKSFKTIPCLSDNRSVIETFDVVSTDSKLPITYYKTKTLEIQEDFSNNSKKAIEIIQNTLNL
ncbi:MAG: hypothetical protein OER82_06160, partial [Nitrosopumilus sp.]|nr:hypothetical protein [Nitrosopumilus sp.]